MPRRKSRKEENLTRKIGGLIISFLTVFSKIIPGVTRGVRKITRSSSCSWHNHKHRSLPQRPSLSPFTWIKNLVKNIFLFKKPNKTVNSINKKLKNSLFTKYFNTRKNKQYKKFTLNFFLTLILTVSFSGINLLFPVVTTAQSTSLAIEPITWDFVGTDSNKPETQGPNIYVVGARVCNQGSTDAVNVKAKFYKDGIDNGYTYIRLQGADTYTFSRLPGINTVSATRPVVPGYVFDTPANGALRKTKYNINYTPINCQDFYYNFEVTRTLAAHHTYQRYYIESWADNAGLVTTPRPRQIYIEQMISQARNSILNFTCKGSSGSVNVEVGEEFECIMNAYTSTAYPQLTTTTDIPNVIFQILDVNTTYSNPGAKNSTVYADGCGWVQNPSDPRYHNVSLQCEGETGGNGERYTDQYPFGSTKGATGNAITTKYKLKVIAFPPAFGLSPTVRVSNIILDNSGGSYHYNADYGIGANVIDIIVNEPQPTDLSVTKTHTGNFSYGDNTYTLTVSDNNNSSAARAPVTLTDTLPSGYTFKDMNPTQPGIQPLTGANAANWNCTVSGQVLSCLYDPDGNGVGDNFPDGATNTLTLNVNIPNGGVPSGTTSTNFVQVALNTAVQDDSNLSNNTASDPTTLLALPNLSLAKTSTPTNPAKFEVGVNTAKYTLTATNSSIYTINAPLTLVDTLPTGITFNSVDTANTSADWSCGATDATKQTVRCTNNNNVPSNSNTQVTLNVDVSGSVEDSDTGTDGVQVTNRATISSNSQETTLADNTATLTNTVNKPLPDVAIFKTDSNLDFIEGSNTNYYFITVTNVGSLPTTGTLTIRDTLPQFFNTSNVSQGYFTYVGVIDPATGVAPTNWSCITSGTSPQTLTCNSSAGFALAPGQSSTLRFQINIPNVTNGTFNAVTNTATIDAVTDEIVLSNNTSSDTTNIVSSLTGNQSNISVAKTTTTTPTGPGQTIAYQLLISNTDTNQDFTKGLFEDIVPSQITGVSATCTVATGTGFTGTGSCCTLSTTAVTGGTRVACASNSFIALPKKQGQNFATVRINISGTVAASGNIYNGASVSIDPTDTVKDKDATDNYDSVSNTVPAATLTLAKTAIPSSFSQGELVTYRLAVTNPGSPNTLNSIGFLRITDPLPSQYTYISSSSAPGSSGWQCDAVGQNITCFNNTTLTPGQSTAVDLLLRVNGNGSNIINTATLTRPDGTTTTASNTQNIAATVPDLVITKTANNIGIGQQGSYTIKVRNIGSGKAAAPIIVRDTLPTGLSFISGSGTGWSCTTQTSPTVDPQTVICTNYTDIAGNNTFASDLTINVLVSASVSGSLQNIAKVNLAPDTTIAGETAFTNNTTTINTTVGTVSDLGITKTATDQDANNTGIQVTENEPATYTITVTNNGPSNYTGNVVINENLPATLSYLSHSNNTVWNCSNGTGACTTGNQNLTFTKTGGLQAGQSSTITLNVFVGNGTEGSNITNTASINATTLTNAGDPTGDSNDSDNETVTVLNDTSDLVLSKDDNDGDTPNDEPTSAALQTKFVQGGQGKYTLVVTNNGPASAKKPVKITENTTLPTGLTYAGYSLTTNWKCTGTIGGNGSDLDCRYGLWTDTNNDGDRFNDVNGFTELDLPANTTSGVEILVNVSNSAPLSTLSSGVYTGLITNTGKVTSANNTTGVTATEQTAIIQPIDLSVTKTIGSLSAPGTGTYAIVVTNQDNNPTDGITIGNAQSEIYVTDYLPTGLTYAGTFSSSDGSWSFVNYNDTTNEVTFKRASGLNVNSSSTINVNVNVAANAPATVRNLVRVTGTSPEVDNPNTAVCDRDFSTQPVNNCFVLASNVTGGAATDIQVIKKHPSTDSSNVVDNVNFYQNSGDEFSYIIQVRNNSTTTNAEQVTLIDPLPPSLQFVSVSIDAGDKTITNPYTGSGNLDRTCGLETISNRVVCNLHRVSTSENSSDPIDITVTVRALVSGVIPNTATVFTTTADSDTTNNSESESVNVINPATGKNIISGTVFADNNNNGSYNNSPETITSGVKVQLYKDNGSINGQYDINDTLIATTTTSATDNGNPNYENYSFTLNLQGTYIIKVDEATLPQPLSPNSATQHIATFSSIGNSDVNNDFGHQVAAITTDFGDAPDTYKTTLSSDGPRHTISTNLFMGTNTTDAENDAVAPLDGIGDDSNNTDDEDGVTFNTLKVGDTSYSVTVKVTNNTTNPAYLAGWIDFNKNGTFENGEGVVQNITVSSGTTNPTLQWTSLTGLTAGDTYARFRLSTDTLTTADFAGAKGVGEVEDYKVTIATSSNPNVLLVKRITSINGTTDLRPNGQNMTAYNQDDAFVFDDNQDEADPTINGKVVPDTIFWPNTTGKTNSTFLIGAIDGGEVEPGDVVEYTIYFLSAGDTAAKNTLLCDRLPSGTQFQYETYGTGKGVQLHYDLNGDNTLEDTNLTNVGGDDQGRYFPPTLEPSTVYPDIKCGGPNTNGAIVVELGDLPKATASGIPTTSYGYVRFRAKFTE